MSVTISIQRELYIDTDDYCVNEYNVEAEVTHWFAGSIDDWDYTIYSEDGEKADDIRLTPDEVYKLFNKLSDDEGGDLYEHKYG